MLLVCGPSEARGRAIWGGLGSGFCLLCQRTGKLDVFFCDLKNLKELPEFGIFCESNSLTTFLSFSFQIFYFLSQDLIVYSFPESIPVHQRSSNC